MLVTSYKAACNRCLQPLAVAFARLRIAPSAITFTGLALVLASCLFVLLTKRVLAFCVFVTVASLFDALDGAVARASGRVTKLGAYLDALCDRYAEASIVLSVAIVTGYWALSILVLTGALLVSYAKARAAMEVSVSNLEWPDLMERTERGGLYLLGLAASALLPVKPLGHDLFWWTLVLLAVLIHGTVIQRMRRASRLIQARSR